MKNNSMINRKKETRIINNNFKIAGIFKGYSYSPELVDASLLVVSSPYGESEIIVYESELNDSSKELMEEFVAGESLLEIKGELLISENIISLVAKTISINNNLDIGYSNFLFTGKLTEQLSTIYNGRPAMRVFATQTNPEPNPNYTNGTDDSETNSECIEFIDPGHLLLTAIGEELRLEGNILFIENSIEFLVTSAAKYKQAIQHERDFHSLWEGIHDYHEWRSSTQINLNEKEEILYKLGFILLDDMHYIKQDDFDVVIERVVGGFNAGGLIIFSNTQKEKLTVSISPDMQSISSLSYDRLNAGHQFWDMSSKIKSRFNDLVRNEAGVKEAIYEFLKV